MDMALSEEQIRYLNHHQPGEAVARALSELLVNDRDLLSIDANERSITFRFAMYLQRHFPDWTVDCEYNRDGAEPRGSDIWSCIRTARMMRRRPYFQM